MLLLALDDVAFPVRQNLCYHLSKPAVRGEAVLKPSARDGDGPDNLAAMFYGTVIKEPGPFGGRYRMWYHACHRPMNPDWPADIARQFAKYNDDIVLGPACYAESDDGITWEKPALGQVKFKGSTANNVIDLPHGLTAGLNVIRDDDEPDPARRYKMVYEIFPRHSDPPLAGCGRMSTIVTAASPDGLQWTFLGVPYVDHFIEQSGFYKHDGKYIVTYQAGDAWGSNFSEGGNDAGRNGLARYSHDFDHWVDGFVESLMLPEPIEPEKRGSKGTYPQNHLGVAPASFGNVCVGVYGLWWNHPVFHDNWCDLGLAISSDGLRFREPVQLYPFIRATDSPAPPHPSRDFHTNLCQGNGIFNDGDETRIYHGRWRNTGFDFKEHYYGEVALASIPRDRWGAVALFPNRETGVVWTQPLQLADVKQPVTVNADGASGLRIAVVSETFEPIADDIAVAGEEGFDLPIELPGDVPRGETVRLGVRFTKTESVNPKLFALNVEGAASR